MIVRQLAYLFSFSLIPLITFPVSALEEELLDYGDIAQPQCRQAIQEVERKLNTYNVRLTTNRFNIAQLGYTQAPQGSAISFWMQGSATDSILMSEKMMLKLSTQIMNNCAGDRIIGVDFAKYQSGWFIRFGVVNGKIKRFDGGDDLSDCDDGMTWGTLCTD